MGRASKKTPANFSRNARILAGNVRRLRQEAGLSQDGLAEAAKVRQALISEVELGEANPTLESLTKIANALKIPVANLFGDKQ